MMKRRIWLKHNEIPNGTKVMGIRVKTPTVIATYLEDKRGTCYAGDEGVVSDTKLVYIEVTLKERAAIKSQSDVDELAEEMFPIIAKELKFEHYRVNRG